jgi:phage shock protein PspC (stress-responsive transcriptional regulator)
MTDTWGRPAGPSSSTDYPPPRNRSGGDWWSRRPRRSRSDSKIAGVAGGLGRYLGVDPILFRVGFVALAILGGAGVLAYCLLWLLLPADGDDVSAGESLIGRGRSSVSPILAVGLALLILISISSSIQWGLPFWPVAIVAFIALHAARKQRRGPFRPGSDWQQRMHYTEEALRTNQWPAAGAQDPWQHGTQGTPGAQYEGRHGWQSQQQDWRQGKGWSGHRGGRGWGWGCNSTRSQDWSGEQSFGAMPTGGIPGPWPAGTKAPEAPEAPGATRSPFDTPAFWDQPGTGSSAMRTPGHPTTGSSSSTSSGTATGTSTAFTATPPSDAPSSDQAGSGAGANMLADPFGDPASQPRTPPAWDPLGAAPFAWDLPEIEVRQPGQVAVKKRTASPVLGRATMGLAFLTIGVQAVGIMAGWWTLGWGFIAATGLAIVGLGLLVQALSGRRLTLIGSGVLLSVLTVGLTLTGLTGTATIGTPSWAPTTQAAVQSEYHVSTGEAFLDLSGLQLTEGQSVTTSVDVDAGQARVLLPAGTNVKVDCVGNAGRVDCMGNVDEGFRNGRSFIENNPGYVGTVNLTVRVGVGNVEVSRAVAR